MTYRLDASQHAHISSKVCRLEDRLVISLEVEVDHQRLQFLGNDPGLVFHIPAVKRHKLVSGDVILSDLSQD